jgi:hypothetical protein
LIDQIRCAREKIGRIKDGSAVSTLDLWIILVLSSMKRKTAG